MMKPNLFLLLAILCANPSMAQKNLLRLISNYANKDMTIKPAFPENKILTLPKELECGPSLHNYLVKSGKLITLIDGSGKVYQTDSSYTSRIDNTCFEGYNFGAYTFNWKNKIYSLGGWGFWKANGGLRYFDEKVKEWFIVELNEEIPFSAVFKNAIIYPDLKKNKIYLIYQEAQSFYSKAHKEKKDDRFKIQCLDLEKASWWQKPKILSDDLKPGYFNTERQFIPTKWGLITEGILDFWGMIDLEKNRIYKLSSDKAAAVSTFKLKNRSGFFIVSDSVLHCYNPEKDSIENINLNKSDFVETTLVLYKDEEVDVLKLIGELKYYILLCLVFVLILLFALRKKPILLNPIQVVSEKNQIIPVIGKPSNFSVVLTEQERSVFEKITENSLLDRFTTIDELNHILGVKNKDNTIQNKLRSDCLQMINKKFMVFASTNDVLVERERTDFDKRVYKYTINKRYLKKLN